MSFTRPFYAARILGSPDVPVAVREDSAQIVLDSSRAPHVDGTLTLAVPDVALLEDIDPRDARRLVLDVYPKSHLSPLYSPWIEQRRNLAANPTPATTAGYSGPGTASVTADGFTITQTSTTTPYIFSTASVDGVTAGRVYAIRAKIKVTLAAGSLATTGNVRPHKNTGNIYYNLPAPISVPFDGIEREVAFYWTATATVPAGESFNLTFVGNGTALAGTAYSMRDVMIEDVGTVVPSVPPGEYFAPSSTAELRRTRFIGTVNASASVEEKRTLTGWEQVPDGTPRTFDLGIGEAVPDRAGGVVQLQLASDEALLDDFAQLADDKGARAYETSLRGVVNYVLGKIGAALQPSTEDVDVTAYWALTNLVTNPRLANDANGWQTGTGASAGGRVVVSSPLPPVGNTAYRWTAAAGESNAVPLTTRYRVTAGKWYVFTAYICSGTARQARCAIQWWSSGGSVLSATAYGPQIASDVTAFRRMYIIAQCPPGADEAVPYISTLANAAGNLHYATMSNFYEGDELVPYFDGDTADTAFYTYEFQAAAHGSTSTRTPIIDRPPAALTMRAGVSGLAFLAPLIQAAGFRLVCNERREWTLRSDTYREPGAQAFREAVNIIDAGEQLSRSSDEWFDGAVFAYTWTDDDGIEQMRIDAYALPGATKTIRREIRSPYPGPGRAEYAVARAQGRGRTTTVARQADWTEAAEQEFSALLEGTPIQTGIANRVVFDLGANTVTTTSRTTEIPAGAIDLLTGTIDALTGTIDNL